MPVKKIIDFPVFFQFKRRFISFTLIKFNKARIVRCKISVAYDRDRTHNNFKNPLFGFWKRIITKQKPSNSRCNQWQTLVFKRSSFLDTYLFSYPIFPFRAIRNLNIPPVYSGRINVFESPVQRTMLVCVSEVLSTTASNLT